MRAIVQAPGEGERHQLGPGQMLFKATSEHTDGKLFFCESTIPPGFPGPPPHVHDTLFDMFYVLDGVLTMRLGDDELQAEAGTFVCVPPGTVHTFSNPSEQSVRVLNINTPGGFEDYMRELAAALAENPDLTPPEIGRIASRHDFRPI